jgi:ribonuclease P protein component
VQTRRRSDPGPPRVGFTVTRKLGTAVERNRIRRRLKEAVRISAQPRLRPGYDYVFVGRAETAAREFASLIADISKSLDDLHDACDDSGDAVGSRFRRRSGAPVQDRR